MEKMNKLPFPTGGWTTFIQWKGTEVCMDWYCPACGKHNHEDRDFMYEVECVDDKPFDQSPQKGCGAVYVTGTEIQLYRLNTDEYLRWGESNE